VGDPRRLRKRYSRPRHPWEEEVLRGELRFIGEFGLRSKRELWIAQSLLRRIRRAARSYQALTGDERVAREKELVSSLHAAGLVQEGAALDDILSLSVSNILDRRLQTLVNRKGLAKTIHHARQLITHGHILVNSRKTTTPGYLVKREEEPTIMLAEAPTAGVR